MTRTQRWRRRAITFGIIFIGLWAYFTWFGSQAEAEPVLVVREAKRDLCPPTYRNGQMFTWNVQYRQETSDWPKLHVWTFGPWNGRLCANQFHIWTVGEPFWGTNGPEYATNPLSHWNHDAGAMRIADQDNNLPTIHRTWRTHFFSSYKIVSRHCYPRLTVTLSPLPDPVRLGGAGHCDPNIHF